MKVLVTGANGFIGKNLVAALKNIRDGKDKRECYQPLLPLTIFEHTRNSTERDLREYCNDADFVFNLAGVNRPLAQSEFMEGNAGFTETLIKALESGGNKCPIVLTSSIQASLQDEYLYSPYGKSKLAAEDSLRIHAEQKGTEALIYRLPNVYGKWCRPNYNSVIATFCYNVARGIPIQVNNPNRIMQLVYIDDVVEEMLQALIGNANKEGDFCHVEQVDEVPLRCIAELIYSFKDSLPSNFIPSIPEGAFEKKLLSTYISYLPEHDFLHDMDSHSDNRGVFSEFVHSLDSGQVSINVTKPGVTKGQHWHNTKWEKFCVVSGEAKVQMRKVGLDQNGEEYPVLEFELSGDKLQVLEMVPGYTHNLINTSSTQDMIAVIWCNENFDPNHPDTYFEEV